MKITKLSIRNIASIVEADIDFERDLIDRDTGLPAQMFLIYGDTGTGKSVLLDAISMALFGTTPRIREVADQKNNKYTDVNHNEVSLTSLVQYVRVGMPAGSDCYSRLTFEGNDGVEYVATCELGLTRNHTYRAPKRILRIGDAAEIQGADQCNEAVLAATGMTFDQFSRMAMLAQGQFTAFLCGKRSERADILEKLTNTEKFSAYGDAIRTIAKRYDGEAKDLEIARKTNEQQMLPPEEVRQLQEERTEVGEQLKSAKAELERLDAVIGKADACAAARKNLLLEQSREASLKEGYPRLAADLELRRQEIAGRDEALERTRQWLVPLAGRDALYMQAAAVVEKLRRYDADKRRLDEDTVKKQACETRRSRLAEARQAVQKQAVEARKSVEGKQQEIDLLEQERKTLDADQARKEQAELAKHRLAYNQIQDQLGQWDKLRSDLETRQREGKELDDKVAEVRLRCEAARKCYEVDDAEFQKALKRHTALHASIDNVIVDLRSQIKETALDTCPLCGQHIDPQALSSDIFAAMLTPLAEERDAAGKKADGSKKAYDEVKTLYDGLLGQQGAVKKAIADLEKDIAVCSEALSGRLQKAGLSLDAGTRSAIEARLKELDSREEELVRRQEQASALQTRIEGLRKEKMPLDAALQTALAGCQAAQNDETNNENEIVRLQKEQQTLLPQLEAVAVELDGLLREAYPEWKQDVAASIALLSRESAEYTRRKADYERGTADLKNLQEAFLRIAAVNERVLKLHPDWKVGDVQEEAVRPTESDWNTFAADVAAVAANVMRFGDEIKELQDFLEGWYRQNGIENEQALRSLRGEVDARKDKYNTRLGEISTRLETHEKIVAAVAQNSEQYAAAKRKSDHWKILDSHFGGDKFRNLVQTYILRPLLDNANVYLRQITDRYTLTCLEENEQLSILVRDEYNRGLVRSATVLSGGEKFMISLALSLALSSLNREDMNVNILFIDEGFGTLDQEFLDSVMRTLGSLSKIAGQTHRRVGIITHREELMGCIPNKIKVVKSGEGRSTVEVAYEL